MQWRTSRQGQGLERGLAVEFAVAIAAVVFVLEGQRPFLQLIFLFAWKPGAGTSVESDD